MLKKNSPVKNSRLLGASDFTFWLEDETGKKTVISGRDSCQENDPDRGDSAFIRIYGDSRAVLRAEFKPGLPVNRVCIHGDLDLEKPDLAAPEPREGSGEESREEPGEGPREEPQVSGNAPWKFFPLELREDGRYALELELPRGGYFSFRLAAVLPDRGREEPEAGESIAWEPWPYHRLMIDPPGLRCLKLYTLIPTISGTIPNWTRELDRIKELGFNAVHILPFTAMGPSESPYSAVSLFSIDPSYLESPDDFDRFVDRAVELKIALCFDIVLNHVSTASFLAESKAHWLQPDCRRDDGLRRAGAWHMNSWISWEDLALINYDHPDPTVRREIFDYMKEYLMHWGAIALRTGGFIRLDNLHSSHRGFIYWILEEMRREAPGLAVLSEFFGANETLRRGVGRWGLNLLMANPWEYPFAPQFRDYLKHVHATSHAIRYLLEPTSHDTPAAAELFGSPLSAIPRYFCCALMGTGQTGIVQGYELGVPRKINFIGRQGLAVPEGTLDLRDFIGKVNRLLEDHPVFQGYDNIEFPETGTDSLIAALRRDPSADADAPGSRFLLAANFDTANSREFTLSLPEGPEVRTLLLERCELSGAGAPEGTAGGSGSITIRLGPCGAGALSF